MKWAGRNGSLSGEAQPEKHLRLFLLKMFPTVFALEDCGYFFSRTPQRYLLFEGGRLLCVLFILSWKARLHRQLDATCLDPQSDVLSALPHLSQHGTLGNSGGLLQHAHVVLQVPDGHLHHLQVALDFLQLLLLLHPHLLQQAALLVMQDLVESLEVPFDACLQIFPDSLHSKRKNDQPSCQNASILLATSFFCHKVCWAIKTLHNICHKEQLELHHKCKKVWIHQQILKPAGTFCIRKRTAAPSARQIAAMPRQRHKCRALQLRHSILLLHAE